MKTETKKTPCDGTRHAGPCSGGDWDPCTIPKGPRGYASRLRDGNLTDEDHEYEASLKAAPGKPTKAPDEFSAVNLTINSLEREVKKLERDLTGSIEHLGRRLAEAQDQIEEGRTPSTCGIVQGLGNDIDMKVARLDQAKTNLANFKAAISHDAKREVA